MKTGWSRAEILALHPAEFEHHLATIVAATPKGTDE